MLTAAPTISWIGRGIGLSSGRLAVISVSAHTNHSVVVGRANSCTSAAGAGMACDKAAAAIHPTTLHSENSHRNCIVRVINRCREPISEAVRNPLIRNSSGIRIPANTSLTEPIARDAPATSDACNRTTITTASPRAISRLAIRS